MAHQNLDFCMQMNGTWAIGPISWPIHILDIVFLSLKIDFVLANSADPDEMARYAAYHLVWVSTVCESTVYGFSVYKELIEFPIIASWTCPFSILVYLVVFSI